ncbi:NAD-dependent epimerase/dehydratase family protein [uncultured Amnibacterium sp.]|uniref:NAD-dependent epimerase/dehydratase family protein n=1 Tax=uncultured Amnibacterium sp. TaxID=1631851 RepID=UPI0035CBAB90
MRVFVTAPDGYVGAAIARELLEHGYEVTGLAPSEAAAVRLRADGIDAQVGSVVDLDALAAAASGADGVIHEAALQVGPGIGFPEACAIETRAVEALGTGLAGTGGPFVVTSGVGLVAPGADGLAHEDDELDPMSPAALRAPTEHAADVATAQGVRASVLRFAWSVHGDHGVEGFLPGLITTAKATRVSAYVGAGTARWSAVHRRDLAHLYRLALESAAGGARLHAVAEEGVTMRAIAEGIGAQLGLPVVSVDPAAASAHFGWLAPFVQHDAAASSVSTRSLLGWAPIGAGLLADIAADCHAAPEAPVGRQDRQVA